MNLQQLMDYVRLKARDKDGSLRTNAELIEDINEACDEAYLRSGSQYETTQTSTTPTAVQDGLLVYGLAPTSLQVYSVRLVHPTDKNRNKTLIASTMEEINALDMRWQDAQGNPSHYITDFQRYAIRLYPLPTAGPNDYSIGSAIEVWQAYRGSALVNPNDVPDVDPLNHRHLAEWVLYRIFSDHDLDVYDEARGLQHQAKFDAMFGDRPSAKNMRLRDAYK
ncbi:MAG: hypothetical protein WBP49_15205, partial [Acidimicrobiia bacterium]